LRFALFVILRLSSRNIGIQKKNHSFVRENAITLLTIFLNWHLQIS